MCLCAIFLSCLYVTCILIDTYTVCIYYCECFVIEVNNKIFEFEFEFEFNGQVMSATTYLQSKHPAAKLLRLSLTADDSGTHLHIGRAPICNRSVGSARGGSKPSVLEQK